MEWLFIQHKLDMMKNLQKIIFILLLSAALSACTKITTTRGYIHDPGMAEAVRVDIDTKETVEAMLGNPTMKATFDDNNWYYYDKTSTQWAIMKEKVIRMNILAISFDTESYVSEIRKYTIVDNKIIDPITKKTITHGKEVNFFAELFGNVGRFGAADNSITAGN